MPIYEPTVLGKSVVKAIKTNQRKVMVPEMARPYQLAIFEYVLNLDQYVWERIVGLQLTGLLSVVFQQFANQS